MMIAIPSYSQIIDLIKKGATLEAQEQIMQLREAALRLQEENIELKQELQANLQKVAELEKRLAERASLRHVPPVYYAEGDPTPLCPLCVESGDQRTHLFLHDLFGGGVSGECKLCGQNFTIKRSPHDGRNVETIPAQRYDRLAGL